MASPSPSALHCSVEIRQTLPHRGDRRRRVPGGSRSPSRRAVRRSRTEGALGCGRSSRTTATESTCSVWSRSDAEGPRPPRPHEVGEVEPCSTSGSPSRTNVAWSSTSSTSTPLFDESPEAVDDAEALLDHQMAQVMGEPIAVAGEVPGRRRPVVTGDIDTVALPSMTHEGSLQSHPSVSHRRRGATTARAGSAWIPRFTELGSPPRTQARRASRGGCVRGGRWGHGDRSPTRFNSRHAWAFSYCWHQSWSWQYWRPRREQRRRRGSRPWPVR